MHHGYIIICVRYFHLIFCFFYLDLLSFDFLAVFFVYKLVNIDISFSPHILNSAIKCPIMVENYFVVREKDPSHTQD